jgi:hypothetical protein
MTHTTRSIRKLTLFGVLAAVSMSCHDGTGPKPGGGQPALATHLDSLFALGDTSSLTASGASVDVVWVSRNRSVALVTQTGRVSAIAPGATYVLAMASNGLTDSALVVVQQRVASIAISPGAISRSMLRKQQFLATALDGRGTPVPSIQINWSVGGSGAAIDNTGLATATAVGTSTISATAGSVTGTATLTVTPLPSIHFTRDTFDLGVGQYADGNAVRVVADSIGSDESFRPTLSIDNTAIANVSGGVVVPEYPGIDYAQALQLTGLATGVAHLTVSALPYSQGTSVIRVSTPRLVLTGRSTMSPNAGFDYLGYVAVAADSLGNKHNMLQPLAIRLRTTAPGVLAPADTIISMPATPAYAGLPLRRGTPGQSWVIVSAPGYQPDSLLVSVTGAKVRFTDYNFVDLNESAVGAGEVHNDNLLLYVGTGIPTDLTVTFTQRHPDVLRFPASMLLSAYDRFGYVAPRPTGLKPGTDTIVATAPGYLPDTLILDVTTGTYLISNVPAELTIGNPFAISGYVADSLGTIHVPASSQAKVLVSSSNPAVLRPASDTMTIGDGTGGSGFFQINVVGTGTATLTLRDPLGLMAPKTSVPITIPPAKLVLTTYMPTNGTPATQSLGMHQGVAASVRLSTGGYVLPDGVQLRSSDPTIAQPSVTSVMPFGTTNQFAIVGGDRDGSAWIVASAPGIGSDSLPVDVGKPTVVVITQMSGTVGQANGGLVLELRDQAGQPRATNEDVTFRIVSSNSDVAIADALTVTVRKGRFQSDLSTVRFVGAGTAVLRAIDDRTAPFAYETGASDLIVVSAPPSSP